MGYAIDKIKNTVINGGHLEVESLVKEALENDVGHQDIINFALIAAMEEVGQRFSAGKFFIPEMLAAAMTMKKGLGIIQPLLAGAQPRSKGTILIGTVRGDLHVHIPLNHGEVSVSRCYGILISEGMGGGQGCDDAVQSVSACILHH